MQRRMNILGLQPASIAGGVATIAGRCFVTTTPARQCNGSYNVSEPILTIRIPMRATSINKWQRMHWNERRHHRNNVFMLVRSSMPFDVVNGRGWPAQEPVSLRITAYMRPPVLDADNVTLKDVVDSLKGWIVCDDDARFVTAVTPLVKRNVEDVVTVEVFNA